MAQSSGHISVLILLDFLTTVKPCHHLLLRSPLSLGPLLPWEALLLIHLCCFLTINGISSCWGAPGMSPWDFSLFNSYTHSIHFCEYSLTPFQLISLVQFLLEFQTHISNFLLSMTPWSSNVKLYTSPIKSLVTACSTPGPPWSLLFGLHRPKILVPSFISFSYPISSSSKMSHKSHHVTSLLQSFPINSDKNPSLSHGFQGHIDSQHCSQTPL